MSYLISPILRMVKKKYFLTIWKLVTIIYWIANKSVYIYTKESVSEKCGNKLYKPEKYSNS